MAKQDTIPAAQGLDSATWESLREGVDYTEAAPEEEVDITPDWNTAWIDSLLEILVYAALVVALILVLYYLLKSYSPNRKVTLESLANENPDRIEDADLQGLYAKALEEGKFTLALRIHYLMILQALTRQGKIAWRKRKTNQEYLWELQGKPERTGLATCTELYEWYWYGEKPLTEQDFASSRQTFDDFLSSLKNPPRA